MRKTITFLSIVLLALSGCSSLTFIPTPPKVTIATTDYVNTQMQSLADKTSQEVLEKTQTIIDEAIAAEREKVKELEAAFASQQKDVQTVLASINDVNTTATQIREIVGRLRKDLNEVKKEVADSLDSVWGGIDNLSATDMRLQTNIAQAESNINALEQANEKLLKTTDDMKIRLDGMSRETILELRQVLDTFLQQTPQK
jgi:chromosome segregation ATPase